MIISQDITYVQTETADDVYTRLSPWICFMNLCISIKVLLNFVFDNGVDSLWYIAENQPSEDVISIFLSVYKKLFITLERRKSNVKI